MNLIILEPDDVGDRPEVTLSGARAAHLLTVLKVTSGQSLRVGLLDGPLGTATVTAAHRDAVTLRCAFDRTVPPRPRVDLLLALPRPKVMRRLWAQLSALGVSRIILTNAARVERNYFDAHVLTAGCYRPLLIEGLQQTRDTRLPTVSIHRQFRALIEDDLDGLSGDALRLVADAHAEPTILATVREHRRERVLIAIGPEGGWNGFELGLLETHDFRRVGMGPRTLRSDTACVALLALTHGAMDEG